MTQNEWVATEGGNPLRSGDWWLLPSGASMRGLNWCSPSADRWENVRARLKYRRLSLEQAQGALAHLHAALSPAGSLAFRWTTDLGPAPTERDEAGRPCPKAALARLQALL